MAYPALLAKIQQALLTNSLPGLINTLAYFVGVSVTKKKVFNPSSLKFRLAEK
jgi:hypothetical protein